MFHLLLTLSSATGKQCTPRKTLYSVDKTNYTQFVGVGRPVYLRMSNAGCPFAPQTERNWQEASQLYPNVDFVTVECIYNSEVCRAYGAESSPYHVLVSSDNTILDKKANSVSFAQSSSGYGQVIQKRLGFYSFDSAPMEELSPLSTDEFYNTYDYPIFLIYDSNCQEDIDFVGKWLSAATEDLITENVNYGFGRIDCSKYPQECSRWGSSSTSPSAIIYSKANGGSVNIADAKEIVSKVHTRVEFLSKLETTYNTPAPVPTAKPTPAPTPITNVKRVTLEEYEKRSMTDLKNEYKEIFIGKPTTKPVYTPSERTPNIEECEDVTHLQSDIEDSLAVLNYMRKLAGVPANATNDATMNDACYKAAKVMTKLAEIKHDINDYELSCTSEADKDKVKYAAKYGNLQISSESVFDAMQAFAKDLGEHNLGDVGHRRWLLYPYLQPIGIGFYPSSTIQKTGYTLTYPPVSVMQIKKDDSHPNPMTPYTANNFTAWPAAGPFPYSQMPESWSIYYPLLNDETITVEDLVVRITRDDGANLNINKLYINRETAGLPGVAIIELTQSAVDLCLVGHSYHVELYILKGDTRHYLDYNFELFDEKEQNEICVYNTDISKCSSSRATTKLSLSEFEAYTLDESHKNTRVIVDLAEPLTLTHELRLDYSTHFLIRKNTITGTIIVGHETTVDMLNPQKTDFVVEAMTDIKDSTTYFSPVYLMRTGKVTTGAKVKSLTIDVVNTPSLGEQYRSIVYEGELIQPVIKQKIIKTTEYNYLFQTYYDGLKMSFTCMPVSQICLYRTFGSSYELDDRIVGIGSFKNLANVKCQKDTIRIYVGVQSGDDAVRPEHFPIEPHHYEIIGSGRFELYYTRDLLTRFKSLKITGFDTQFGTSYIIPRFYYQASKPTSILDSTKVFEFASITVDKFDSTDSGLIGDRAVIPRPGLKGNSDAISIFQGPSVYKEFHESDVKSDGFFYLSKTMSVVGTQNLNNVFLYIDGSKEKYSLGAEPRYGDTDKQFIHIKPEEGKEDVPVTFEVSWNTEDHAWWYPVFYNFKKLTVIGDYYYMTKSSFVNVSSFNMISNDSRVTEIKIDTAVMDAKDGEVTDISSTTTPTVYTILKLSSSGTYKAEGTVAANLQLENINPTIHGLSISTNLSVDTSNITLVNCNVHKYATILLNKKSTWPSVTVTGGTFEPKSITINLNNPTKTSSSRRLLSEEIETYALIKGLNADNIDATLSKITLQNNGNFQLVASKDKTTIYATTADPTDVDNIPESAPSDEVIEVNPEPTPHPPVSPEQPNEPEQPEQPNEPEKPVEPVEPEQPNGEEKPSQPTTGENQNTEDVPTKISGGAIAGIVIAVVAVVGVSAFVAVYVFIIKPRSLIINDSQEEQEEYKQVQESQEVQAGVAQDETQAQTEAHIITV